MIVSFVDIGTNSIKYLVYDITNSLLLKRGLIANRIGEGMGASEQFSRASINLCIKNLKHMQKELELFQSTKILVYGTRAFRFGKNSQEFIEEVSLKTGLKIQVLTGEEEARYSFLGGATDFIQDNLITGVLDIGGGSTEICLVKEKTIIYKNSFSLGVVFLKEKFQTITQSQEFVKQVSEYIYSQLKDLQNIRVERLICVGGTATTFASMTIKSECYHSGQFHGMVIHKRDLEKYLSNIAELFPDKLNQIVGLPKERQDIILPGVLLLLIIVNLCKIEEIIISDKGLLFGILSEFKKQLES